MYLRHRRPNIYGLVNKEGNKEEVEEIINSLLKEDYKLFFLPSGSAGVFISIFLVRKYKKILIPDMGGWRGFLNYPNILEMDIEKIKTNLGVVEEINYKNLPFIITSLPGYLTENNLKKIKEIAEDNKLFFIEDISGKIGGDCGYGDIVVASTGSPKILNCEYGGFIGVKEEIYNNFKNELNILTKTYKTINYFSLLKEELLNAKKVYKGYVECNFKIKRRLNTLFKDKESLSVFIGCKNNKELSKNINSLIKLDNKKSLTTLCPNYERILKKGVVFETKKIQLEDLKENLREIIKILVELCL